MKKTPVWILIILCFLISSQSIFAEEISLKVEVLSDQSIVKAGDMFLVTVRVINQGEASTGFWANTCSYEKHWVTDQPGIAIQPWTCKENDADEVTLEPDDVYEKNIMLYLVNPEKSGPLTFRLGFKRMSENNDVAEPIWSDPITLRVVVPEGQAVAPDSGSGQASETTDPKGMPTDSDAPQSEKNESDSQVAKTSQDETSKSLAEKRAVH